MDIYLDIDGTLIHEDLTENFGRPAAGLVDFFAALKPHRLFWLTTHCRDGDPSRAQKLVKHHLPETFHPEVDRILGTTWETNKTEGIDWSVPELIWFDNDIFPEERAAFGTALPTQTFIEVDLRANPEQIIEITRDIFG